MKINKIALENIRSYESLDLEFQKGSTLLSGDIGTGKTTILLAIEFALFGLQPGQKGTSLLRNGKDEGKVILDIEVEGRQIIIERELKRNKSVSQGKVSISIDNAKKETSIKELKNEVLRILNYPSEFEKKTNLLYKFTVYTPQEEMKQIILETSDVRLDTLRHVFGMDRYKKIKENTEIVMRKIREQIREKEGFLLDLEEKKQIKKQKIELLDKDNLELKKLKQEDEIIKKEKKEAEKKIQEIEKQIQEKNNIEKEIEKNKLLFSSKRENLLSLEKQIKDLESIEKVEFNLEQIEQTRNQEEEKLKELKENQEKYNEILGQINFLNNMKKDSLELRERMSNMEKCPTCLQNVNPEYRINISNKIAKELLEIQEKLKVNEQGKTRINQEIEKIAKELETLRIKTQKLEILKIKAENYNKNKKALEEKLAEKKRLKSDILILEEQIKRLAKTSIDLHTVEEIYEKNKNQLSSISEREKNIEIKIAQIVKEIEIVSSQLSDLEKEIEKKEQEKKKLERMNELRDWLSEKFLSLILFVEKNVMLTLREEFSKIFNNWFSMLVSDNIEVSLDEKFTPMIEQNGYSIDYAFLSGGERTAIALAYRLALNQVINSLLSKIKTRDLVILDEPTDGFSDQQLDKMRNIFEELEAEQIILVSHEAKIESFVDHVIKINKQESKSAIEY